MVELVSVARELQKLCEAEGWKFCIIGGLALQTWGAERFTRDVDGILFTGFEGEEKIVDTILTAFKGRRPDAREFALMHRVLLVKSEEGYGVDISLGALPFEKEAVERAVLQQYGEVGLLRICTAEDLIVMKAFANRPQDWIDVENVIIRQQHQLDWGHILKYLPELVALKEEPQIVNRLLELKLTKTSP